MRALVLGVVLFTTGCGAGLELHTAEMSPAEMLDQSTHVFLGVIQE